MSSRHKPILFFVFSLLLPAVALGQSRGGGGGSRGGGGSIGVQPGTNARNAAVLGTGNNLPSPFHRASADDEAKVEFRSQTVLVQVPVVITDKFHNHVHGLKREDFKVFENGKPVDISVCEEQSVSTSPFVAPAAKPGQFRNLTLEGPQSRNVVVIALDTVNTPFLDQAYGRRELIKFLSKNIDAGQVLALMLITSHGLKVVQGLTGDSARLMQALKKASGEVNSLETVSTDVQADAATGSTFPSSIARLVDPLAAIDSFIEQGDAVEAQFLQQNAIETTMNAFLGIAWSMSGVPGRKSLIWATGGFPFSIDSPSTVPGGYLSLLYERTMFALNEAEISVYPVDIRGLVDSSGLASGTRTTSPTSRLRANQQLLNRQWLQQSKFDTLNDFADMTGGKAFYNTNDVAGSFRRAADDGSSYYLLGYYLDTHNNKPGWRKLQVKLDRKDVEIRARSGFFVTNATMNPLLSRNLDMSNALHSPIEGTGVPVTVQWTGLSAVGDKKKVSFAAHMGAGGLSFEPGGRDQLNFEFAAIAYDKDGKASSEIAHNYTPVVPEPQMASVKHNGVEFRNSINLAPGNYSVRFVVRDNVTGKVGSVTAPIMVD